MHLPKTISTMRYLLAGWTNWYACGQQEYNYEKINKATHGGTLCVFLWNNWCWRLQATIPQGMCRNGSVRTHYSVYETDLSWNNCILNDAGASCSPQWSLKHCHTANSVMLKFWVTSICSWYGNWLTIQCSRYGNWLTIVIVSVSEIP